MGQVQMTNTGLVPVIGVERPNKGPGNQKQIERDRLLTGGCVWRSFALEQGRF